MFSLKQLALSVRHILHPRLALVINPSQHYTRDEVPLIDHQPLHYLYII